MKEKQKHQLILVVAIAVFIWSGIRPKDQFTWFLEVIPAVIGLGFVWYYYGRFRLTTLVYTLIALEAIILMVGGHYTYAEVPLFNWLRDAGLFARNNYDKIGHLAQGFVPVMVAREVFLRKNVVKKGWLVFTLLCFVLAVTAAYEIGEWWVSLMSGEAGDAFLGTQGYIWDTQSDMLMAFIGAVIALVFLSKAHNRALEKINTNNRKSS